MTHEYNFEWLLFLHQKYLRKAGKRKRSSPKMFLSSCFPWRS